jgi:hypothetical protein
MSLYFLGRKFYLKIAICNNLIQVNGLFTQFICELSTLSVM